MFHEDSSWNLTGHLSLEGWRGEGLIAGYAKAISWYSLKPAGSQIHILPGLLPAPTSLANLSREKSHAYRRYSAIYHRHGKIKKGGLNNMFYTQSAVRSSSIHQSTSYTGHRSKTDPLQYNVRDWQGAWPPRQWYATYSKFTMLYYILHSDWSSLKAAITKVEFCISALQWNYI